MLVMTLGTTVRRTVRKTLGKTSVACGLVALAVLAGPARVTAQPAQPPQQQDEFRPISELPPQDQLPAAPLLVTAYAFVWIAAMFYVWSIWRRMNKVEDDMRALSQKLPRR